MNYLNFDMFLFSIPLILFRQQKGIEPKVAQAQSAKVTRLLAPLVVPIEHGSIVKLILNSLTLTRNEKLVLTG